MKGGIGRREDRDGPYRANSPQPRAASKVYEPLNQYRLVARNIPMKRMLTTAALLLATGSAYAESPYQVMQSRTVKALSEQ
jgi:hypothetical protein